MATGTTLERTQAAAESGEPLATAPRGDGPTFLCDQAGLREVLEAIWLLLKEANEEDRVSGDF